MKMPRPLRETTFNDICASNTLWQFDPHLEFDLDSLEAANSLPSKNIFEQWIEADMHFGGSPRQSGVVLYQR